MAGKRQTIRRGYRRGPASRQATLCGGPRFSVAYASVFTAPGLIVLTALGVLGVSPMALPFAGGFMWLGPILLTGYFELSRKIGAGEQPSLMDAFAAFGQAPAGLCGWSH